MNLYEINHEIEKCVDMETGEIVDVEKLRNLLLEKEVKVENIALWIKNLRSDIAQLKEEEKRLREKRTARENKVNSLISYLNETLEGEKFKTPMVSIYYTHTEAVDISDSVSLEKLAPKYQRITYEANKTAIKKDLKAGIKIKGISLKQNTSLVVR